MTEQLTERKGEVFPIMVRIFQIIIIRTLKFSFLKRETLFVSCSDNRQLISCSYPSSGPSKYSTMLYQEVLSIDMDDFGRWSE